MNSATLAATGAATDNRPHLDAKPGIATVGLFIALLIGGIVFAALSLRTDVLDSGVHTTTYLPFLLLGIALLIALGFEFVNGFHDTANAVATVIYTHSMPPNLAVVWSGVFNFIGVLVSSGAVAFGIISLLPVELILQVGSTAGFAMVFALLIAAILWNLGTWWLGLPASSSHTLIGSIIGVGIANALMHGRDGTSGVDWAQATKVGYSLLLSPMIGFGVAALVLLLLKVLVKRPELYQEPKGNKPPPWGIRALLVLTCTGVSFAHGSNDGQKGMGLIMLILVGTVPLAYALNRAMPADEMVRFAAVAEVTEASLLKTTTVPAPADPRGVLTQYIRTKQLTDEVVPAVAALAGNIGDQVRNYGTLASVPAAAVNNVRNDMYLTSESLRALDKSSVKFDADTKQNVTAFRKEIDAATKFIPLFLPRPARRPAGAAAPRTRPTFSRPPRRVGAWRMTSCSPTSSPSHWSGPSTQAARPAHCRRRQAAQEALAALPFDLANSRRVAIAKSPPTWPRPRACCDCCRAMSATARPWWR